MNSILEIITLILAGTLAGEEFIVRYGIHPALSNLERDAHVLARQELIKRLRIVVPMLMLPTVGMATYWTLSSMGSDGQVFRYIAVAVYFCFLLLSFAGTVPINIAVGKWSINELPLDWEEVIKKWGFIDIFRSGAAMLGFVCLLIPSIMY